MGVAPSLCRPFGGTGSNIRKGVAPLSKPPIAVLFCTDNNYWQHMGATLASLLSSNGRHRFRILVCSLEPNPENEMKIRQIAQEFGNATVEFILFTPKYREALPVDRYISLGAYLRLFVTEYVDPALDKLLYLDSDLIIRKDIETLWAADIDAYCAAAAVEPRFHENPGIVPGEPYFNSGVMLINLSRWRSEGDLIEQFIACAKQKFSALPYWDQDILNIVLRGRVAFLSPRWNFHAIYAELLPEQLGFARDEFLSIRRNPDIIHFTSKDKPWHYIPEPQYKRCYWEALSRTPWKGAVPLGYTRGNALRKVLKMKRLKQQVRLHGAQSFSVLSRLVRRPVLWSDVSPPPSHLTLA
jgi:lipopolysaccharide biosynthesis glycosyltransferase